MLFSKFNTRVTEYMHMLKRKPVTGGHRERWICRGFNGHSRNAIERFWSDVEKIKAIHAAWGVDTFSPPDLLAISIYLHVSPT